MSLPPTTGGFDRVAAASGSLLLSPVAEWGLQGGGAPNVPCSNASRRSGDVHRRQRRSVRSVVTHYVPVNDASVIGEPMWRREAQIAEAEAVLVDPAAEPTNARQRRATPLSRPSTSPIWLWPWRTSVGVSPMPSDRVRQPRIYPSVTPNVPLVTSIWPDADLSSSERELLDAVLDRVTRLGHSSSPSPAAHPQSS